MARILIVEDEPNMVAGLRDNFEFEGYQVITAPDGIAGLERALSEAPDLVILDVMMPRMSGLDVCKQLKSKRPSIPVIMLTARGQEIDKVVGLELGADDYVAKPVDFEILAAIIDARLGKGVRNELWSRQVALNDRELECLTWSARGKTSPEIATIVGLSKRTVNFHIENACRKLNVSTRTEAVVKATSGRLIDP